MAFGSFMDLLKCDELLDILLAGSSWRNVYLQVGVVCKSEKSSTLGKRKSVALILL